MTAWKWFGQPGHFCGAFNCHWHLHTHVGKFCVSSVGEWVTKTGDRPKSFSSGKEDFYEAMVFPIVKGESTFVELEREFSQDRDQAVAAHLRLCRKYSK